MGSVCKFPFFILLHFHAHNGFVWGVMAKILSVTGDSIQQAAAVLRGGGLVGLPTETVYGVAGNALDGQAVAKIFAAKGRPSFNPLIIHVASLGQAQELAEFDARALEVAAHFWPGPLTLILKSKPGNGVSELASAGLETLALRFPAHKVARAVIEAAGLPIAAPSANKSGKVSATSPQHVAQELGAELDLILAAGACEVGLESSVLDLSGAEPVILRPGAVLAEDVGRVLDCEVLYDDGNKEGGDVKSPGQLLKHYAPSVPVRLGAVDVKAGEALLAFGSIKFMGVEGGAFAKDLPEERLRNLSENGDLHEAAANLFAMLRALDIPGNKGIAVMHVPEQGLGMAINDRLRRAAAGSAER